MCRTRKKLLPKKETFCVLKNRSFSLRVYVKNCQQNQLNCILNMLYRTKYRETPNETVTRGEIISYQFFVWRIYIPFFSHSIDFTNFRSAFVITFLYLQKQCNTRSENVPIIIYVWKVCHVIDNVSSSKLNVGITEKHWNRIIKLP